MERVKMVVAGRQAEVDADQVKKLAKKDALIAQLMAIKANASLSAYDAMTQTSEVGIKLIRLNRTIRHNVRFL
jgi:hypothetical protein